MTYYVAHLCLFTLPGGEIIIVVVVLLFASVAADLCQQFKLRTAGNISLGTDDKKEKGSAYKGAPSIISN